MKKFFAIAILLIFCVGCIHAQTDPKITGKPIIMVLPKPNPPVAFRLYGFKWNNQNIRLVTDPSTNSLTLLLQTEFDTGGTIKGQKFVAPFDAIYHFDARVNLLYPLEQRIDFFRWYLKLMNGNNVIEEAILSSTECAVEPVHSPSPQHSLSISTTVALKKGDVISLVYKADANPGIYAEATYISFAGFKILDAPVWTRPDIR